MWPFRKKPEPPAPQNDGRVWNEDWQIGDTAECIREHDGWHPNVVPWHRPKKGQRFTVTGFSEGMTYADTQAYFLKLEGWPVSLDTTSFRKVRPNSVDESEIVERILKAPKVGADVTREPA